MKNNKAFGQTAFFVLMCALAVLPGCKNVLDTSPETSAPETSGAGEKAALTVTVNNGGERTVFPQADGAVYKLYGNRTDTEPELLAEFLSTSVNVILEPGTWSFTLSAYNQEGALVMQDNAENIEISLGVTNNVLFELSPPMEGEGDIAITLNFPADADITRITVSGDIPLESYDLDAGEETFTWEKSPVNSGFYFVSFKFYRGEEIASVFSEMVQVSGNMTSRKIINLSGYKLDTERFTITQGESLAEKLSWLTTNAKSGGKYLVEVTADEDIAPTSLSYYGKSGITVSMIGAGEPRTVGLSTNGSMFTIGNGVTLSLDNNIILRGRSGNTASLVGVNGGGSLILNSGSSITGNTNSSSSHFSLERLAEIKGLGIL